jgi:hypothetical protein
MIYLPIAMAFIGLAFMFTKRAWVLKQDPGDGKMKEISDYIYEAPWPSSKQNISFYILPMEFINRSTHKLLLPLFWSIFSAALLEIWE